MGRECQLRVLLRFNFTECHLFWLRRTPGRPAKGRKDRNVMLSPETLDLLRQWWKVRPPRYDAGLPVQERWLFPSRKTAGRPMTTRQLSRLFHEAADAAGIKKSVPIRRFLMHVLPAGFHRIRYYGLLASGKRADNIARASELLTLPIIPVDAIKAANTNADQPQVIGPIISSAMVAAIGSGDLQDR
jgi:integrase